MFLLPLLLFLLQHFQAFIFFPSNFAALVFRGVTIRSEEEDRQAEGDTWVPDPRRHRRRSALGRFICIGYRIRAFTIICLLDF